MDSFGIDNPWQRERAGAWNFSRETEYSPEIRRSLAKFESENREYAKEREQERKGKNITGLIRRGREFRSFHVRGEKRIYGSRALLAFSGPLICLEIKDL